MFTVFGLEARAANTRSTMLLPVALIVTGSAMLVKLKYWAGILRRRENMFYTA
jgi:hypothetical protein